MVVEAVGRERLNCTVDGQRLKKEEAKERKRKTERVTGRQTDR